MESACRVCARSNDNLIDIFSQSKKNKLSLAEMLIECVDCCVSPDDPYPKKMCLTCVDSTKRAFQFKRKYEKSYQHFSRLLNLNNNCQEPECDVQSNSQSECQDDQEAKENERDNANGVTEEDIMERLKFEEDEEEEENEMEVSMMEPWQLCHVSIRNETTIMETDTNGIPDSNAGTIDKDNVDKAVFKHFCDTCRKGFPNNTKLIQHSIDHYNLDHNQCPYCSKTYKSRHSLRQHVILHSGERPYECPYCQKAFFYKESRKSHMRIHTGDQSAKSAVEKIASTSSLPPECNFKCMHCPKSFKTNNMLQKHIQVHSSNRPFQCPQCPYRFKIKPNLQKHLVTHLSERPHICEDCKKSFKHILELKRHKRFTCPVSNKIKNKVKPCPRSLRLRTIEDNPCPSENKNK